MFPIRLPQKVSEHASRHIPETVAAAASTPEAMRARTAALTGGRTRGLRMGSLVAVALLSLSACSTMQDSWDSVFGSDGSSESETGAPSPDGLNGVAQPPAYSNGTSARRMPSQQYALNELPNQSAPTVTSVATPQVAAEPVVQETPAPVSQVAAPAPAPEPVVEAAPQVAEAPAPVAPPVPQPEPEPEPAPAPQAMAAPVAAPEPVASPVPEYVPPTGEADDTTTVVNGNGKVTVQSNGHAPAGASGSAANVGGLAMGLSMTGSGPYPLEAYNSAGTAVSTQVATIQFGNGAASLSARDRAILRQVVALQKQHNGMLRVVGHASSRTGDMSWDHHDMANLRVSQQRARAVMNALIEMGAPRSSLYVGAVADNEPMYQEVMPTGEAANRRTEVFLDY
ncbi:hypothetical protein GCM10027396_22980 [Insolitispirillum peregrinum]